LKPKTKADLKRRLLKQGIITPSEPTMLVSTLLSRLEEVDEQRQTFIKQSQSFMKQRDELRRRLTLANASYHKLRQFIKTVQMFKDIDFEWDKWPESSIECIREDLQQANKSLQEERKQIAKTLAGYRKFPSKPAMPSAQWFKDLKAHVNDRTKPAPQDPDSLPKRINWLVRRLKQLERHGQKR
jgi:hypothetical protein